MKINLPNHEFYMDEVKSKGFAIVKDCISSEFITAQRLRWIPKFTKKNVDKNFVRGNLILGEKNFLSYSDIHSWCMYRYYEFLWNQTDDKEALDLHKKIHKFRNKMQGLYTALKKKILKRKSIFYSIIITFIFSLLYSLKVF